MENITISITGEKAKAQASAIIRSFYKTMARMEDGGCHIQMETKHVRDTDEIVLEEIDIPDFMNAHTSRRACAGRR